VRVTVTATGAAGAIAGDGAGERWRVTATATLAGAIVGDGDGGRQQATEGRKRNGEVVSVTGGITIKLRGV